MELIEKILNTRQDESGHWRRWGKFLCPYCLQIVERLLFMGKKQKSCGCAKGELIAKANGKGENHFSFIDGRTGTRLYNIYRRIKRRCSDKNNNRYGGRGITICPEWAESYIVFKDWALNNGYKEGLEIDRKNNNGNYEPNNCRWVTHKENCNNRDLEHYKYKKSTKLREKEINEIRYLHSTGEYSRKELAEKYNVSISHISDIVNYKKWKNIV